MFRPRSTMLTLYGDYVRHRGGEIGIGSLIKLLSDFGLSEQSTRSAVSRMCREGLLKARREGTRSYYSLRKEGFDLLGKGAQRIFEPGRDNWDGIWSIVVYFIPEEKRQARDRLRTELSWMGYGPLSEATWISPHDLTTEVEELAEKLQIKEHVQVFQAKHQGLTDPHGIVSRCWDLSRIHKRYASFVAEYHPKLEGHQRRLQDGKPIEPSACFVERFKLIHEYRRLPFLDPDLPEDLLPRNWLRRQAAALFQEYHHLLTENANKYFDSVLKGY